MSVFLYLLKIKSGVVAREEKRVSSASASDFSNKAKCKMHVFKHFHNKWKIDSGRDDENVKIAANVKDDNTIQVNQRAYQKSDLGVG